ncbi:hypothetical protein [Serratia marcescens]|uniref:hypothetical protein n=1 Tax=Serratia marcescens TaxID=615 RepID=UPI00124DDE76|nr:hypothetical protein [Serratia marcescens]EIJ7464440.1 hypothetical protein [Serratia marcescens]EJA2552783.1 hypothetical protein [Serratia marcescens]EJA2592886.1 hypothetical protein [Serratia marcescens]QFH59952.1 hypothetical protein FR888_11870 [Serratia marcescens]UMK45430.1 hypothetical protein L2D48_11675 [Serratia marcescens]
MAQYPLWHAAALAALCAQLHILALFFAKSAGRRLVCGGATLYTVGMSNNGAGDVQLSGV